MPMPSRWKALVSISALTSLDLSDNQVLAPSLAYTITTDPVPRGLLTLCPWASSDPQGLYTAYIQPVYSLYTAYIQPIYSLYTACLPCSRPTQRAMLPCVHAREEGCEHTDMRTLTCAWAWYLDHHPPPHDDHDDHAHTQECRLA